MFRYSMIFMMSYTNINISFSYLRFIFRQKIYFGSLKNTSEL